MTESAVAGSEPAENSSSRLSVTSIFKTESLKGILAFVINTLGAVSIIFVNKQILSYKGFSYVATLTALHFSGTAIYSLSSGLNSPSTTLSWFDLAWYTMATDISVLFMNISLQLNTVGLYQVSKLCLVPVSCIFEVMLFRQQFTAIKISSIFIVLAGVWLSTVSDVKFRILGVVCAGIAVFTAALHQVGIAFIKKKYNLASRDFLAQTAPMQALSLLILGPLFDKLVTGRWVFSHTFSSSETLLWICLSIFLAVAINASQVVCVSHFTAVGSQVLGHTKTVLVLLIAWLLYEPLPYVSSGRQLFGAITAIIGMVLYSFDMATK